MNAIPVAPQSINAWVLITLSSIFSEHFTTRCLLSIEDSFISALDNENCEIPKLEITDKGDSCPEQLPSLLSWLKLFPTRYLVLPLFHASGRTDFLPFLSLLLLTLLLISLDKMLRN